MKKSLDQKDIKSNPFYDKAVAFRKIDQIDSSFIYFDKAKDEFLLRKDSANVGKCFANMGYFALIKGDFYSAQELSLKAILFFNENIKSQHSSIGFSYNNFGRASYFIKDYENAIKFYDKAINIASESNDKIWYLNNKAKAYEDKRDYQNAINIYSNLLKDPVVTPKQYAMILANMSFAKWLQNTSYNPISELFESLKLRQQQEDIFGQNYVYARLSDYYTKKNFKFAQLYAEKMLDVATKLNSPDDKLEALEKLVKLSSGLKSKQYFENYRNLEDSVQMERSKSKNQFALIRYETEKHKADNLILQKDNAEKKYQLIKQKTILFGAITLLFLGAIFSVFWYHKRKKAHQKEKELEVKNIELKYVKKVHDRVANKVYNVMMEVENTDDLNKTTLADKLESIYKISRDISYESNDIDSRQIFAQQLHQMLMSYTSDAIEISVDGNNENLWHDADETVKFEIITILQELMTNMMKHSQATAVQLDFKRVNNRIDIVYLDNGIGIASEPIFKNGLKNTGNRIEEINGVINFDITVQRGLKIEISFPVF